MNESLTFGSVCSGIEAATVAWVPLGFEPLWYSEIEKFPCRLLANKYPNTQNLGDITAADFIERAKKLGSPDIIIGGTPCQSFSLTGLRAGMKDDRGNLTLTYARICDELKPRITVWENVPGVLSSGDNAFGFFLSAMVGSDDPIEPGPKPAMEKDNRLWRWNSSSGRHIPKWPSAGFCCGRKRIIAWRVLDSKYFGVPQQRRRIFVVGCSRTSGLDPCKILFEREGLPRTLEKGKKKQREYSPTIKARHPRRGEGSKSQYVQLGENNRPRVLMHIEYERLQGFPEGYTAIDKASDTARYKAVGNSMTVPVIRWIGKRIGQAWCPRNL